MHLVYDYLFVGSGASASLLLMSMEQRGLLQNKRIALVDPSPKAANDKTFCFWARPTDLLLARCKHLVSHQWENVSVNQQTPEALDPWTYNHIPGSAVYHEMRRIVESAGIDFIQDAVHSLLPNEQGITAVAEAHELTAKHVFDSRPPRFQSPASNEAHLLQSFIGYLIETENERSSSDCVELMDFSVEQLHQTQFMYVLPFGQHSMLVELTRFGEDHITDEEAEPILDAYIRERFGNYRITGRERGCIPMSTASIEQAPLEGLTRIGSRAGAVKPSTGYAFKTMFAQAEAIAEGLAQGNAPAFEKSPGRFKLYDRLLLDILRRKPHLGKPIFATLFKRNRTANVLRFLDEKTSLALDLRILFSLPIAPFLAAWQRDARVRYAHLLAPAVLLAIAALLISLSLLSPGIYQGVQNALLALGLLAVGIPHGAVDHLLESRRLNAPIKPAFVLRYLGAAFFILGVWLVVPTAALLLFLVYSAWHFGQGDVVHWQIPKLRKVKSWLWGITALGILLLGHANESRHIISMMNIELPEFAESTGHLSAYVLAGLAAIWGLAERRMAILFSAATLALAVHLPLLAAFGLYFIGQHSMNGWGELRRGLAENNKAIYTQALPFTLGAIALFGFGAVGLYLGWLSAFEQDLVTAFFVFLSCISFPHVVAMHGFLEHKLKT